MKLHILNLPSSAIRHDSNADRFGALPQRLSHAIGLILITMLLALFAAPGVNGASVTGEHGIVATVHPLATEAAIQAMKQGGNAIDAAVAAALTLGVVDGHNSGLGGGCFMLIRLANGSVAAIDGREMAPARATRDMFLREGKVDSSLSLTGPLAAGVPAYDYALKHYGKLSLKALLLPAAQLADQGFPINRHYAARIAASVDELKHFEAARSIFLRADGTPFHAGEILRQPDLARSYRAIAATGTDWFYRGPFAKAAGEWMTKNGGLLRAEDFQKYQARIREPVRTTYRGCEIIGFPPPSSGGVHVAQILNVLECFDLKSMGANSADFIHVVAETMKLAFADRAHWLGDPDFAPVPLGLISKEYAARLARQIKLDRVTPVPQHGTPEGAGQNIFGKHTTHFSTADAEGNWVACTATVNTSFGSKVVVPGTGVVLNNQMDDFSIQPGVSNFFGLIGAEANAVAPGKRPLSSMSPTIVLKDGKPILSVGAAGGPTIISQTLLAIINTIDFGLPVDAALAQARFHHQWKPDELQIERKVSETVRNVLVRRGHKLQVVDSLGAMQAVGLGSQANRFSGAHDPRLEGKAAGF